MSDVSISALRVFRAVARCGSFSAAARDLGCAQSAISRHVALLESALDRTLVLRGHRKVQLTEAGERYLETVARVLDELDHGAARIAATTARPKVKLLAMPSFAARWLIPRLARLSEAHIDVDIELATSIWDADFRKERFDLAIHYGDGAWPGARLLMHDSLVPVASPALLAARQVRGIDDLARLPWLHDSLRSSKWPQWLEAFDAGHVSSERHMKLQDVDSTLSAAIAGLGVAMGHAVLVDQDVREGRLRVVLPRQVPLAAGYHLVVARKAAGNPLARPLAEWLMREAAAFRLAAPP